MNAQLELRRNIVGLRRFVKTDKMFYSAAISDNGRISSCGSRLSISGWSNLTCSGRHRGARLREGGPTNTLVFNLSASWKLFAQGKAR